MSGTSLPRGPVGSGCGEPIVPFHRSSYAAAASKMVSEAIEAGTLQGGGRHTAACHALLRRAIAGGTPFLTTSGTHALEMAALILDLRAGDEVVMPSWTFPSTANAVALRGATPVFVDVCPDTLNIDPGCAERALTRRTRALVCVHYAGVGCDMDRLGTLCASSGVTLIEDAAQAFGATWRGRPLGSFGDLAALSFHGTKTISSGEGGALIVNRADLLAPAEIAWEKGTNRLQFQRGLVENYEWCELGCSFLPSELTAALLEAQLRGADAILAAYRAAWCRYAELLQRCDAEPGLRVPKLPAAAHHNGHIFAIRLRSRGERDRVIAVLREQGIEARTHYQPLHSSQAGRRYGRAVGSMAATEAAADGLLRLPLDAVITAVEQERVVAALRIALRGCSEAAA